MESKDQRQQRTVTVEGITVSRLKPPERQTEQRTTTKLKGCGDKACQEQSASPRSSKLSTVYQECNQHLRVLQRVQHQPSAAATSFPSQSEQKWTITLQLQIFGKDVSYEERTDKG